MAKKRKPRKGSLGYKPHKRASRIYASIDNVKDLGKPEALGFAGYKAGMTRVLRIEDRKDSEFKGQEVADAVTMIECPPLKVFGLRLYNDTPEGEKVYTDIITGDHDERLERKVDLPEEKHDAEEVEEYLDEISDIKLLVHTQPYLTTIGKKKPEVFELPVGGDVEEKYEYAKDKMGEEIAISEVFEPGEYLDVIGITKGKGFQGAVKRHGVKPLPSKAQKIQRKAGNLGPWHPDHTSWKVPQAGQMGNARRTEFNKRLLQVGETPEEVNPDGGIKKYGELRNEYMLVKGSVPGPAKRLVMLRSAIRKDSYPSNPNITHIDN